MRKNFSVAACALALVFAGAVQAGTGSDVATSVASQVGARLQQFVQLVQGTPVTSLKSQAGLDASSTGVRSRTAADSNAGALQTDKQTSQAMLLAGLLVMGVIIKRRSGKRD